MQPSNSCAKQRATILALLIASRRTWVPVRDVAACVLQYSARVHQLRRLGHRIENKQEGHHSWFRLESGPAQNTSQPTPAIDKPDSLFGDLSPQAVPPQAARLPVEVPSLEELRG